MKTTETCSLWVVYQVTIHGKPSGISAVCEQDEWDAMELDRPGYHTLVHLGIPNEGEAERMARTGSGYDGTKKPSQRKRPRATRASNPPAETAEPAADERASLAAPDAAIVALSSK